MIEGLQTARLIIDSGMCVLIWMVQLIIYPAFHAITPSRFSQWHSEYMQAIGLIVMPLMLLQALFTLSSCYLRPGLWSFVALACMLIAWAVTALYSVPAHQALQSQGYQAAVVDRLVLTNWIRTLAWSALFLTSLYTAIKPS
jgi:hypothetical protein